MYVCELIRNGRMVATARTIQNIKLLFLHRPYRKYKEIQGGAFFTAWGLEKHKNKNKKTRGGPSITSFQTMTQTSEIQSIPPLETSL